jgi:hypothetical protein
MDEMLPDLMRVERQITGNIVLASAHRIQRKQSVSCYTQNYGAI